MTQKDRVVAGTRPTGFLFLFTAALLVLGGCTDLTAVQKFAAISADSAAYTGLVGEYVAIQQQIARYAPREKARREAEEKSKARAAQVPELLALHSTVTEYMQALGALAADDLVNYDEQIDGLGAQVASAKFASQDTADAAGKVAKLIARAATDAWRRGEIRNLIGASNEPLQVVVGAMRTSVDGLLVEQKNEDDQISSYFETTRRNSSDRAGKAALAEWRIQRTAEVTKRRKAAVDYKKILDDIGNGHQELYDHRNDLEAEALVKNLERYTKELKALYNAVTKNG